MSSETEDHACSQPAERRLAAILSADAVGYSRLMAADEAATVRTITTYRGEISRLVEAHGGRVIDAPGDNLLAEFPTATGALQSALAIQQTLRERNAELASDRKMEFRIGVHVGEIRLQDERIYGDGVNIAARLEALAEPSGICISAAVHEQTRSKVECTYEDLGRQKIKNILEPVQVLRVRPGPLAEARPRERMARNRVVLGASALVISIAVALAGRWMLTPDPAEEDSALRSGEPSASSAAVARTASRFGDRPAIAVLPFENLSGDPDQEYFADGIAEDLITRLSSWKSFPVIARNSSFVYKGAAVDIKRVREELGVGYVDEGSVRKAQDSVRITAQLIDAETGHHVWAQTYDRKLADIFAVQDEISNAIAASTLDELGRVESARAVRLEPGNLDAWDLLQRARWYHARFTAKDNARARELSEQAIGLDPYFAAAFSMVAASHYFDFFNGWTDSPEKSVEALARTARTAVEIDPGDAYGHTMLAVAFSLSGEGDAMFVAAERAVELNPSMTIAQYQLGFALAGQGRADEAVTTLQTALRLSPRDPNRWAAYDTLAFAYYAGAYYDEAVAAGRRSVQLRPTYAFAHLALAVYYGALGRTEEGRTALAEALRLQPDLSSEFIRRNLGFADPDLVDRYIADLRSAGWQQ